MATRATIVALPLVLIAGLAGCKGDEKPREAPPASAAPAAVDGAAARVAAPAAALDEAAVRRHIDAWLAAQNGGDFAAYQTLYADRMEGIKRVGPRTWRFDRAGWLADRQRMFQRPMQVQADDVAVTITGSTATVELVQTYQQGKFRDRGPKQLVVVSTPAGLRIAREEMLASTPEPPGRAIDDADGLRFVIEIDERPYLILAKADDAWATGDARGPFPSSEAQYMALRDAGKAPAAAAAWVGRALTLHGSAGSCRGTVESLAVVGGGTPHFAVEARWAGSEESDRPGQPMPKAEQAAEVLGMSDRQLVGALKVPDGCDPLYAVGGTPAVYPLAPTVDDALADKARAAFRELPAYRALQKEFEAEYGGKGPWTAAPTVRVFTDGTRRLVSVEASEGAGCGEFSGALWAMYEDKGKGLALLNDPARSGYTPHAVLDADGDGTLEIVGQERTFNGGVWYVALTRGEPRVLAEVVFPYSDCGC